MNPVLKEERSFVKALSRGISILEAFNEADPELGITEIARKVDLSKTTTFRLVRTLVALNYLVPTPGNGKYRLGPRVLSLGFNVIQTMDLKTIAAPHLQALSKQCDETVNMAVLDEDELVYIERIKTQQIVNINLHIGSRLQLYNTAMGRALLSGQSDFWIKDYIERMAVKSDAAHPYFDVHGEKLKKIIETVRIRHYAVNDEDLVKGLRSIAAVVWDADKKIAAAINIAVPSARVTAKELKTRYAQLLLQTACKISEALGYRGGEKVFELKA